MPIENERKYIILETKAIEQVVAEHAEQILYIEQKYLVIKKGLSVRVRSITNKGVVSYRMTLKKNVAGQCVEVECPIIEDDFTKLWSVGYNKVIKVRYPYQGWDIDFFKHPSGYNYFAVAEIEMLPWQIAPEVIPELITNYIIFAVPLSDRRFSNKKLGNIKYATQLLEDVKRVSESSHVFST